MGNFTVWLDQNWFNLAQTLGIVGSVLLATVAFCRETKARRIANFLTLAQQHRELWSETHRRPELARIVKQEVDLVASPLSVAEEEFLNLVIVHFQTGWLLANESAFAFLEAQELAADLGAFLSLPLARALWQRTKAFRNPRFVEFVERECSLKPYPPPVA